ncbi:MAG: hypothetical protein HZB46_06420 [Solirubrobacterales bacterium]|nr:hypothetical protein [Solirubrobacterales bacterium]
MQFNLHSDYAKAVAPRPEAHAFAQAHLRRGKSPPAGRVRSGAAGALAAMARRLDGEAARRAVA